jgi:hypothetical protein
MPVGTDVKYTDSIDAYTSERRVTESTLEKELPSEKNP